MVAERGIHLAHGVAKRSSGRYRSSRHRRCFGLTLTSSGPGPPPSHRRALSRRRGRYPRRRLPPRRPRAAVYRARIVPVKGCRKPGAPLRRLHVQRPVSSCQEEHEVNDVDAADQPSFQPAMFAGFWCSMGLNSPMRLDRTRFSKLFRPHPQRGVRPSCRRRRSRCCSCCCRRSGLSGRGSWLVRRSPGSYGPIG